MAADAPLDHDPTWPVVSLVEITSKIGSGATPTGGSDSYLPKREHYALVRSQNVFDRRFEVDGLAFISDLQAAALLGASLQADDVLLNITGDGVTFGRACRVPAEILPACVNQHVSIIRVDPSKAVPGYVLAFLTHPSVKPYIESFNAGGSRRAITKGHIESFCLPLPPFDEQRAIASILGTLDDKIELNRRMNGTLMGLARHRFRDSLGTHALEEKRIGDICEVFDGPHATPQKTDTGPIFLGISNLSMGRLALESAEHLSDADYANWTRRVTPQAGDVVFSYETRLGEVAMIPSGLRCCLGRRMGLLRAKRSAAHPAYLLHAYLDFEFQETIRSRTVHGSTVDRIPLEEMRDFPIRLPRLEQQVEVASFLQALEDKAWQNVAENATLAALRDLLLPKLISGEIRVGGADTVAQRAAT